MIAGLRPLSAGRASAPDEFKIQPISADKVAKSPRGLITKLPLALACGAACFWRIESDKPNVRPFVKNSDCIAVNHMHVACSNRRAPCDAGIKERDGRQLR